MELLIDEEEPTELVVSVEEQKRFSRGDQKTVVTLILRKRRFLPDNIVQSGQEFLVVIDRSVFLKSLLKSGVHFVLFIHGTHPFLSVL